MPKLLMLNGKYLNISGQLASYDNLSDLDNNQYTSVKIGNQIWLTENLRTTKYSNGTPINNITGTSAWASDTNGAYCWYNNDYATYGVDYGAYYNWYAVNHDASVPGAALVWLGRDNVQDTSWRVASVSDWNTLLTYAGGISIAAYPLRETSTAHWANNSGTDLYNFSVRGNGDRGINGTFGGIKTYATLWTSIVNTGATAYYSYCIFNSAAMSIITNGKNAGYCVRCVKDG